KKMSLCAYGPPRDSDDSDDSCYDGFYFSDEIKRSKPVPYVDPEQKLYEAVIEGNVSAVEQEMTARGVLVDHNLKNGWTMLLMACQEGHYDLAEYLLTEKSANVNGQVDSLMPLMMACDCQKKDPYQIEKLVRLLLQHGAVVNVSDKYGMTAFMFACKNGYAPVVRLMIKDVSFDAVDNNGCTPIFHAIEGNHIEVARLLVEAGVDVNKANYKGYTPAQVAECHGYNDILEILPKPPYMYTVPSCYLSYNTIEDQIPRIFLKSNCPEYFQEINGILQSISLQSTVQYFSRARTTLGEFLSMNDQGLKEVGIEYPIYRNKIRKAILDFHLHHWTKVSIPRVKRNDMDNFYEILMIAANHLQQLVIIQSSLRFILMSQKEGKLGNTSYTQMASMRSSLQGYSTVINELSVTVKYLASCSPARNPLYIDYNEILAERKRKTVRKYFKYTTIILGISVFLCFKCKWFA
ncbi:hypothetical protein KR018_005460, partial [Drosophila ironensis]